MTPERWGRLQMLFHQARELAAEAREPFLRESCADDTALLAELRELLESEHTAAGFIEKLIGETAESLEVPSARSDARLGAYRLVRQLGAGGMGEVYLAERDDRQFRRQVAIKLVRTGFSGRTIAGRLRAERQILANLHHPNIAGLLDGGTTDDGVPYLVMEYIEGEPIDRYCDLNRADLRTRLRLFRDVCSAVHHAHRNLIVHRDLKPSNILVTPDGEPKLLDFGIAKILDPEQSAYTLAVTQADVRMMTPDHAAPEQLRGDAITTAADVYALGVLLYQLLCGRPPFDLGGKALPEVARIICEAEPMRPSARLATQTAVVRDAIAECHSTTPERLQRQLAGDLDTIALTALRKEPQRRYQSAEQFAADIQRHLTGMPVIARDDTWGYRTGKFVSRHRLGVATAALIAAMLAGFGVVMSLQAERIAAERDDAARQRERAEQISSFLINLFELSDPSEARGNVVTAREILDQGAQRIERELRAQPELRALLQETIGNVYHNLGLYDRAAPLLERSLAAHRDHIAEQGGVLPPSALNSLGRNLAARGRLEQAEQLHREALAVSERIHPQPHTETADSHQLLAQVLHSRGDLTGAEQHYQQAIELYSAVAGGEAQVSSVLNDLAQVLRARGDYAGAEQMLTESLRIDRRVLGEDHPHTINDLHNLAVLIEARGEGDRAEPLFRDAIALGARVLGPGHPDVAIMHSNLGRVLHHDGRYAEAQSEYRRALDIARQALPEQHPVAAYYAVNLALLLHDLGDHAEAERHYRDGLAIYAETLEPDHQYVASALTGYGRLLADTGRSEEAREALERALQIWQRTLPADHWQVATTRSTLGYAMARAGARDEARELLATALETLESARGSGDPRTRRAQQWLQELNARADDPGRR